MCQDILENGTSTEGELVRPHWEDGTSAYTIKKFGVVNRYDLSKEFPAITLRKTYIKSATDELLWIWQKKSNNILTHRYKNFICITHIICSLTISIQPIQLPVYCLLYLIINFFSIYSMCKFK